ncbi:ELMO/CED-12 family-domain-containing protein [Baffinella frigidus]|nr:ELMO/CED-12 family-domain-containing protein [Cryptophyta sp. CCMP2293]
MTMRHRGKTAEIVSVANDNPDDEPESASLRMNSYDSKKEDSTEVDDNQEPLLDNSEREGPGAGGSTSVARSRDSVGVFLQNLGTQIKNMDFKNASLEAQQAVKVYWAAARDWVAEVPGLMQRMQDCLPDSFQAYTFTLSRPLTPEQQEIVDRYIEQNVGVAYTHDNPEHWALLLKLWNLSFPASDSQPEQQDSHWKKLGFQGTDPATDFRSAGFLSVTSLVYFAETYPDRFAETVQRSHGQTVEDSYPFACVGINVVFLLTDVMKLRRAGENQSADADAAAMRATWLRQDPRTARDAPLGRFVSRWQGLIGVNEGRQSSRQREREREREY